MLFADAFDPDEMGFTILHKIVLGLSFRDLREELQSMSTQINAQDDVSSLFREYWLMNETLNSLELEDYQAFYSGNYLSSFETDVSYPITSETCLNFKTNTAPS